MLLIILIQLRTAANVTMNLMFQHEKLIISVSNFKNDSIMCDYIILTPD